MQIKRKKIRDKHQRSRLIGQIKIKIKEANVLIIKGQGGLMEGNILYSYHAALGYACPPKYTINAHDQSEDTTGRKATLNVNN